jgi:hypothetical protein
VEANTHTLTHDLAMRSKKEPFSYNK